MKYVHDAGWIRPILAMFATFILATTPREAAASAALDDDAAAARLEEMKHSGTLRDPVWAKAYWVRSESAPTGGARIADLRWALQFDAELQGARLDLAAALFRERDPECATQLLNALLLVGSSFPVQQRLAVFLLVVGGGVSLAVLVFCAMLVAARAAGALHHAITERLGFLPPEARGGAALLTLGAPFLVTLPLPPSSAVFWALALGTAGTWTLLSRGERRLCAWALAGILILPWGMALWTRLLEPSDPRSYARLLWETQGSADPATVESLRHTSDPKAVQDPDHLATLALAARRKGDLEASAQLLRDAIRLEPDAWSYHNNLGNTLLLSGDPDGALRSYAEAKRFAPTEPSIRMNEAQAYLRKLEFPKASEALEQARRLGAHLPTTAGSSSENAILFEETLDAPTVWTKFLASFDSSRALDWKSAWSMSYGILLPLRPFTLCIPLLLALFYVWQARRLPRIHTCASCGKTVCRKCHYRVLRQSLCADCYSIRTRVRAPIQREEALSRHMRRVRRLPWLAGFALAALCPGAGHLLEGRPATATALLFFWAATWIVGQGRADVGPSAWNVAVPAFLLALSTISVVGYVRLAARRGVSPFRFGTRGA
jgi:tetratricopeptide (TPR) repeat protein